MNKYQEELIKKASISGADVIKHMDNLNKELDETYKEFVVEPEEEPLFKVKEELTMTSIELDLDKELEAARRKLEEVKAAPKPEESKEAEPELSPEDQQRAAIYDLFSRTKGAPTPAQIEGLKAKYGKNGISVLVLGEDDVYIFTYLRRSQFEKITEIVQSAAKSDLQSNPDKLLKEKVVQYCVKWPTSISSVEFLYNSRAGVIDSLYQAIMLNSYFLSPQQTVMLTTQL